MTKYESQRVPEKTGFSVVEVLVVLAILLSVCAVALPSLRSTLGNYRIEADAHGIAGQLALARMRASARFTQVRLNFTLGEGNYQLQIYNKSTSAFDAEGGTQSLSSGVGFGFGSISSPAGAQTSIQQTQQMTFNSRGIPVDSGGAPTGNNAIYLSDSGGRFYAVTVAVSGQVAIWIYNGSAWQAQ